MNILDFFLIWRYESSIKKNAIASVIISSIYISSVILINFGSITLILKTQNYSISRLIPDEYLYKLIVLLMYLIMTSVILFYYFFLETDI